MALGTYEERQRFEDVVLRAHAAALALDLVLDAAGEALVHHTMNGRRCFIIAAPDWNSIRELTQRLAADVVELDLAYFGEAVATGARYPSEWSEQLIAQLRS